MHICTFLYLILKLASNAGLPCFLCLLSYIYSLSLSLAVCCVCVFFLWRSNVKTFQQQFINRRGKLSTQAKIVFFSYKCLSAFDLIIFDLFFQIKQQRKKRTKNCRQVRLIFLSLFFLFSLFLFSISSPVHSREKRKQKNYFLIPVNWHQPGVVLRLWLVL